MGTNTTTSRFLLHTGLFAVSLVAAYWVTYETMAAAEAQEHAIEEEAKVPTRFSYDYLESLMPNGEFVKDPRTEISNNTSRGRYHPRMKINTSLDQDINRADSVFLYCTYGVCGKKKHPKVTFKATQFKPHHWNKKHKNIPFESQYIKIFSVWDVDYNARKYKKEYLQLNLYNLSYFEAMTPPASPPAQQPVDISNELPADVSNELPLEMDAIIEEEIEILSTDGIWNSKECCTV